MEGLQKAATEMSLRHEALVDPGTFSHLVHTNELRWEAPGAAREAPRSSPGRAPDTSRLHPGLAGGGGGLREQFLR